MKQTTLLICLAVGLSVASACAHEKLEVAIDRMELFEVVPKLSKLIDKEITVANRDLNGRLVSIFSPRPLTKTEIVEYAKGVLMFRGVGWRDEGDAIVLFRVFDEEEAQRVFDVTYKSMMGIPLKPQKRRSVVLPPAEKR